MADTNNKEGEKMETAKERIQRMIEELEEDSENCVDIICSLDGCANPESTRERLLCDRFALQMFKKVLTDINE